jgi:hypothetical protein
VKARFLIPETRRLVRLLFAQRKVPDRTLRWSRARELGVYLKGCVDGTRHYVWSWRDPVPMGVDNLVVLGRLWKMSGARLSRAFNFSSAKPALSDDTNASVQVSKVH